MPTNMQTAMFQKTAEVIQLAYEKYGFDIPTSSIEIKFVQKGRAAGRASYNRRFGTYGLEFSIESARLDMDEMLNDTIPHEVAHLVCFHNPQLGKDHDFGWKRICIGLGGTGKRTHNQVLTKAKYRKQYLYRCDTGREVIVKSAKKHNKIMRGAEYIFRDTGEKYGRDNFVRIISAAEHRRNHMEEVRKYAEKSGVTPLASNNRHTLPNPTTPIPTFEGPGTKAVAKAPRKRPVRINGQPTKAQQARQIVNDLYGRGHGRKATIQRIIDVLDMTPAGASTYFYNAKKALGL